VSRWLHATPPRDRGSAGEHTPCCLQGLWQDPQTARRTRGPRARGAQDHPRGRPCSARPHPTAPPCVRKRASRARLRLHHCSSASAAHPPRVQSMRPPEHVDRRRHVGQGAVREVGLGRRTHGVQVKRAAAAAARRRKRREIDADGGHASIIAARRTRMELCPILRDPGSGAFSPAMHLDQAGAVGFGRTRSRFSCMVRLTRRRPRRSWQSAEYRCLIWATAGARFACSMLRSGFGRALLAGGSRKGGGVWRLADS